MCFPKSWTFFANTDTENCTFQLKKWGNLTCNAGPCLFSPRTRTRERIGKRWLLPICTRAFFNHLACTYTGTPRYTSMGDITPTQLNGCQQAFKRCFNVETASSFNVKITLKFCWVWKLNRRWNSTLIQRWYLTLSNVE